VLVDDYITEPDKNVFDNYSAFIIEVVIWSLITKR
jgi:hypothetical protein